MKEPRSNQDPGHAAMDHLNGQVQFVHADRDLH
jgi:hypothetical protein